MGYDVDLPIDNILSHSRAFDLNPRSTLLGGVDPDKERRDVFSNHYSAPVFPSVKMALRCLKPQIVVIAAPTDKHAEILSEILILSKPSVILCEKPLSYSLALASSMVDACEKSNTRLFVNYMRRADSAVLQIKQMIETGQIQVPFTGSATYSKGIVHNGTHMIDLLSFWFGAPVVEAISIDQTCPKNNDGTPDATLRFASGSIQLKASRGPQDEFSLTLGCSNGVLEYQDFGKSVTWNPMPIPLMSYENNTKSFSDEKIESSMLVYQLKVVNEIVLAIEGTTPNLCSGHQSLESLKIATHIMEELWSQ